MEPNTWIWHSTEVLMHGFQLIEMNELIYLRVIMAFVACETSSFAVYFLWKSDIVINWKRNPETQKPKIINQQGGTLLYII